MRKVYRQIVCALMAVPAFGEEAVPVSGGPPIPGVCVLSREAVFDASMVGQDVTAQFKKARDSAQSSVNEKQTKVAGEVKALETSKAQITEDQYKTRQKALADEMRDLRLDAAQKSMSLEAARQGAVKKIADKAQPFIAEVYQRYRCSLLLSRDAVLAGNPGMDVTGEVIKGLDKAITKMPLDFSSNQP